MAVIQLLNHQKHVYFRKDDATRSRATSQPGQIAEVLFHEREADVGGDEEECTEEIADVPVRDGVPCWNEYLDILLVESLQLQEVSAELYLLRDNLLATRLLVEFSLLPSQFRERFLLLSEFPRTGVHWLSHRETSGR